MIGDGGFTSITNTPKPEPTRTANDVVSEAKHSDSPWEKRQIFSWFYDDPFMTESIIQGTSSEVYVTRLKSSLLDGSTRVIVAVTENVSEEKPKIPREKRMSSIPWRNLHILTFDDERYHHLPSHNYSVKNRLNTPIYRLHKTGKQSLYAVEGLSQLTIILPHKKDTEYSSEGSLVSALELFNTIISIGPIPGSHEEFSHKRNL
jgi:hypothetical protein